MKYVLMFVVLVCSYLILDYLNKTEKIAVYKQCLIEYNYQALEDRYRKAGSTWTKQRIEHRAIQIKNKCYKKAKEHISV